MFLKMKVVYYSQPFFADCDFPLVREMQKKGVDVRYYIPLMSGFRSCSILDFPRPIRKWGIYRASSFPEMHPYRDCVDLDRLYFIIGRNFTWWPFTWFLWFYAFFHILFQRAEIMHIIWQLRELENILLYIPFFKKKVMTVHDPIQHSNIVKREINEKRRLRCFRWADVFILLNNIQLEEFSKTYNIDKDRIIISKLGVYDSISKMSLPSIDGLEAFKPYILFFGSISPHKGVDYLLKAMVKLHSDIPNVNLIIAGNGQFPFDTKPYEPLDYIRIENRYIGIKELVSMVKSCLFVVCPYIDATQSGVIQTSFALNAPVVASNVGALPEMVVDDKFGKIVPPCDVEALKNAMNELIEHPAKLANMKENIRSTWKPSMSWSPIADNYIDCYK